MSWAQAAGDGADRGTGPQAHSTHPSAAVWGGVWAGTARAGCKSDLRNLILSGMSLHTLSAHVLLTSKQRPAAPH